jgi:peptidoglycan/xylan/chitin deacetylase (PgdA/CDA1 family)
MAQPCPGHFRCIQGAIVRGDSSVRELALVFTGDEYADGGMHIAQVLKRQGVKGSFFLTGKFYRNPDFVPIIEALRNEGHYLGAHSDQHLLYCDWEKRDRLLVTREEFMEDLKNNYKAMKTFGIESGDAPLFLPPFEWYNDSIAAWTASVGLQLINYTHGTLSHADYTVPGAQGYRSSQEIYSSVLGYETDHNSGLSGFILLSHIGTEEERTDKFYLRLEELISALRSRGYRFKRIDELLDQDPSMP